MTARRPPFDPELVEIVQELESRLAPGGVTPERIPALRSAEDLILSSSDEELSRDGAFTIRTIHAPSPDGAAVPLLVCRLRSGPSAAVVYYVHGGGMVAGDARNGIEETLDWAQELSLSVVSVDYRLAPEHPHPAPVDDAFTGLNWTQTHLDELSCPSGRIIVAGASAGGGLAAGIALMARDRSGPPIHGLMLMAPMLDDRNDSESGHQLEGVGVWDRRSNATGWSALLGASAGGPDTPAYAAPARAGDLGGLPPMLIDVGSAETFRDEAGWIQVASATPLY